jgi:hypothetical protein
MSISTLINYISGTVNFSTTPNGITQPITDNSTLASTTAFIQSYLSSLNLISLSSSPTIIATVNFASVITTLLAGSISSTINLIIKGSTIAIGKTGGALTIMGNNVPISSTFPSAVVSFTPNGSRIQAGTFTTTSTATTYTYPQSFTSSSITIVTPRANNTAGTQALTASNVSVRGLSAVQMNLVAFGN